MKARGRRSLGLTLIETMVAIAIVAVLATLAVPSFGSQLARSHLKAAAERMAADLAEARFESSRRGVPVHVHFEAGAQWCYSVATADPCACASTQACQLRRAEGKEHKGVVLERASDLHFEPTHGSAAAVTAATLRNARGEALRVEMTRLGRAKVCAPDHGLPGYPAC
jgi:type IV fimbrial biogenesis protein FimT